MSYHKAEYLINTENSNIKMKIIPELNNNLNIIYKVFKNKDKNADKIITKIKNYLHGGDIISVYNSNSNDFENILSDYNKEKVKIKTQKVEMRVYQLTEEAKNTQNSNLNNKKKDCLIF